MGSPVSPDPAASRLLGSLCSKDLTKEVRADEDLVRVALTDSLTRLPNRALLRDRLSQALGHLARAETTVAVLIVGVDGLKRVNNMLGHDAGDELLIAIANRLSRAMRAKDTIARSEGDGFVVVAEDVAGVPMVLALGQRLIDAVAEPLEIASHVMAPSISIGIALAFEPTDDATELMRDAYRAMFEAKGAGGGRCQLTERPARTKQSYAGTV